jgi:hypothetical protein
LPDLRSGSRDLTSIGRRIHAGESYDEDALDSAVLAAYGVEQRSLGSVARKAIALVDDDEQRFRELAEQWRDETDMYSSVSQKIGHPAYQQVIAMGSKALPWILRELKDRPNLWFNALKAIAKETPVLPSQRGNSKLVREAWLRWGRERGLIE